MLYDYTAIYLYKVKIALKMINPLSLSLGIQSTQRSTLRIILQRGCFCSLP